MFNSTYSYTLIGGSCPGLLNYGSGGSIPSEGATITIYFLEEEEGLEEDFFSSFLESFFGGDFLSLAD